MGRRVLKVKLVGEAITDEDKRTLRDELDKMPTSDVVATIRRLAQMAARGNVLTGFTREDMEWLYRAAQKELDRRAEKEGRKPGEHQALKWGEVAEGEDEPQGEHMPSQVSKIKGRSLKRRKRTAGEMVAIAARICGEMNVDEIPVSPAVDAENLKAGDDDPLEVVVEVPTGKSKRGWDYLPRSLQDIVDVVNAEGLPGYEGHQDPANVDWEFRTPVTHWVGSKFQDGRAYFRGIIDKAAADLKRWIRGGIIKTVSIWGTPTLAYEGGETKVIGYDPLSIDWTPPRRAGMPTRIVAVGEMDSTLGEMDGSLESLLEDLRVAAARKLGVEDDSRQWVGIERTFEDYVIVATGGPGKEQKLYKLDYAVDGERVVLGEPVEVELRRVYEPAAAGEMRHVGGGQGPMTWKELVAQLKAMLTNREVTLSQVAGEMGWKAQEVAGEIDPKWLRDVTGAAETLGKTREALGVTGEMDVVKVAGESAATLKKVRAALKVTGEMDVVKAAEEGAKALEAQRLAEHEKAIGEMLAGKLTSDAVKKDILNPDTQIGKLWAYHRARIQAGATKEQIAGEIDAFLGDKVVKAVIDAYYTDKPAIVGGTSENKTTLRVRREQI